MTNLFFLKQCKVLSESCWIPDVFSDFTGTRAMLFCWCRSDHRMCHQSHAISLALSSWPSIHVLSAVPEQVTLGQRDYIQPINYPAYKMKTSYLLSRRRQAILKLTANNFKSTTCTLAAWGLFFHDGCCVFLKDRAQQYLIMGPPLSCQWYTVHT